MQVRFLLGLLFPPAKRKQALFMLRVSDQTKILLEQLHLLQKDRSWLGGKRVAAQTIALLERIAEQREPVSVSVIARSLFASSKDVRKSACRAIHRILAPLPPDDLLHLSAVVRLSWGWYISDAWDKLKPAEVAPLIADSSTRTTLLGLLRLCSRSPTRPVFGVAA
jgi:hypothetical protein